MISKLWNMLFCSKKGVLYIISGPSGSGKTSVMREVTQNEIISYTTRERRPGERDGVDYHFVSDSVFDKMLSRGKFAEHSSYFGSAKYGATKKSINDALSKGDAYIVADYDGFKQLKKVYPHSKSIFICTNYMSARLRMEARGDSPEKIKSRLSTFGKELLAMREYDFVVENLDGEFLQTVERVRKIVFG